MSSYQAVGQQETGTIQTPPATEQVISLGEITPVSTVDTIQPVRPVKGKVVCEPAEPVEQGEIIMGDIAAPEPEIDEANKVHQFAEIMPKYKGGMIAMMDHLSNYIMTKDLDVHALGTIYVRFVVERDGSLSGFEVMHGFNEAYFQMAMEAAKSMPNWEPGTINGKAVRVYTTVPVRFEP